MTTTQTLGRAPSVRATLVGTERRSKAPHLPQWLTRRQIIDVSIALDALIVFLSFILANQLYIGVSNAQVQVSANYPLVGGFTALIHYVVTRTDRGSSEQIRPNPPARVLRLLLTTFAAVIVIGYGLKQAEIHSRLWLALSFANAFVMIAAKNWVVHAVMSKGRLSEFAVERIALFGEPPIARLLKSSLEAELDNLCQITIYDGKEPDGTASAESQSGLSRLIAHGLNNEFNRIVFCLPSGQLHKLKELVDAINFLPVRIEACLAQAELQVLKDNLLVSPGQLLIRLDDLPQDDWGVLFKRIMDLALGFAFLVMVAPVMVLAAIAIKLESSGPVFFRQRRHGWNHSIISVWKFRTMTVQEDGDSIKQAIPNDPRVTRVGRILRKTSIDELPQLFNVLSGEMSLVGPRPHAVAHNLHYSELIASYAVRHKVKPGITGWAQIKGLRGHSKDISAMVARAEADIWYIRHWSILLDLKIVLLTPFVVLFHKNAC